MGPGVRLEGIVNGELATDNVETAARVLVSLPQSHLWWVRRRRHGGEEERDRLTVQQSAMWNSAPNGGFPVPLTDILGLQ